MFNLEIENKIIEFVKKSPLGVTSAEIATYVGFNRITMTKYLAIIKERALIDFKQLGMAKLWYIPVNINKESFLNKIMAIILKNMPENEFKSLSENAGIILGEEINRMYLNFNGVEKLTIDQLSNAYEDIAKKLNGNFKARISADKISVEILESSFNSESAKALNKILSAVFAKMSALNMGYGKSIVSEPNDNGNVVIDVYLKRVDSTIL